MTADEAAAPAKKKRKRKPAPKAPKAVVAGPPRDEKGRIMPGGGALNPGGRRSYPTWFRDRGEDALRVLTAIAFGEATDPKISAGMAAIEIVDRVWGKPKQSVEVEGEGANQVVLIQRVIVDAGQTMDSRTIEVRPARAELEAHGDGEWATRSQ